MKNYNVIFRKCGLFIFCFALLFSLMDPVGGYGQTINKNDLGKKLDGYITQISSKFEIPGIAIAITKADKIIYKRAFGVRNLKSKESLKPEYIFHMASVSKTFVATAIVQLVERGKIDLDQKLVTYLPYFKLADERYKDITIRQMLNHTSGMPDVNDYQWDAPQYDEGAAERYVRSLKTEKMIAAPGNRFRYSNMAFDVLGDVIAKTSGLSFEAYVKKNILDPLGMKNSTFLKKEVPDKLLTSPHIWKLKPAVSDVYPYNRRHAPSSTLNSSVVEMANWAIANLNKGKFNGKRILKEESYDLLYGNSAKVNSRTSIGLSWFLGNHKGVKTISHSGSDTGYTSFFSMLPEKDIGIIVLSNYSNTPIGAVSRIVTDIVLGFEPKMPKQSIATKFAGVLVDKGLEAAKINYHEWKKTAADDYSFGSGQLNGLGFVFLREKRFKDAIDVFKFNVELYPKVANVFDSLGEAYAAIGNQKLAIENYTKALELDPTMTSARQMLAKLKKGITSTEVKVTPEILDQYVGQYQVSPNFIITISREGDQLFGEASGSKMPLYPRTESVFFAKAADAKVTFNRNSAGGVAGLTLILNGNEMKAKKL